VLAAEDESEDSTAECRYERALQGVEELRRRLEEEGRRLDDLGAEPLDKAPSEEAEAPSKEPPHDPRPPASVRDSPPSASTRAPGEAAARGATWVSRGGWVGVGAGALVAFLVAAGTVVALNRMEQGPRPTSIRQQAAARTSQEGAGPTPSVLTAEVETNGGARAWEGRRHVNRQAGYSFVVPAAWRLVEKGEVSTISSPDGRLVVSFALGPRGPLPDTYKSFVRLMEGSYQDVQLGRHRLIEGTEGSSLLVEGTATAASGAPIRFRVLLRTTGSGGPAIGAIAATTSTGPFDARVTGLLTSVRPSWGTTPS
jgi:hypothetical protein